MSSHQIFTSVVMSLVTRAEPRASTKGPVGESDTAMPMDMPLMVACSTVAKK